MSTAPISRQLATLIGTGRFGQAIEFLQDPLKVRELLANNFYDFAALALKYSKSPEALTQMLDALESAEMPWKSPSFTTAHEVLLSAKPYVVEEMCRRGWKIEPSMMKSFFETVHGNKDRAMPLVLVKSVFPQGVDHDLRLLNAALHAAVETFIPSAPLTWLLEQGAEPNAVDMDGNAPLLKTVSRVDEPKTRVLLEHGADPNRKNDKDVSPLFVAVSMDSTGIVEILVEHDVDPRLASCEGVSVMERAAGKPYLLEPLGKAWARIEHEALDKQTVSAPATRSLRL